MIRYFRKIAGVWTL